MSELPRPLSIPRRVSGGLSFTDGTLDELEEWLDRLPMSDSLEAGQRMRNGLMELNRIEGVSAARFKELELLRPRLHELCARLTPARRTRLMDTSDQGTPEQRLAQMLQTELATGYRIVVVDTLAERTPIGPGQAPDSPGGMATISMHRSITELGYTLLRSVVTGAPPPPRLWEHLHRLQGLAMHCGVLDVEVVDETARFGATTRLVDAWLRVAMIGAADPNSLRPATLVELHGLLERWTRWTVLADAPPTHGAWAVADLAGDAPPERAALFDGRPLGQMLVLDTSKLVARLEDCLEHGPGEGPDALVMPAGDADDLLRHALRAWAGDTTRGANRMTVNGRLDLCVGMAAIHHYLGAEQAATEPRVHAFILVDASPGGYGLACVDEVPEDMEAGDLLGVRKQGASVWHIAVVRWFGRSAAGVGLGIELLAPRAEPVLVRGRVEAGRVEPWTRALLLPEIRALKQAAALIVPRGVFASEQHLVLRRPGGESRLQLDVARSFTESFQEFTLAQS